MKNIVLNNLTLGNSALEIVYEVKQEKCRTDNLVE